ncbi:MAG: glycosyltransferase family 4 protein [bacterium]|nr:glycosyltransferase family 4 protein [bacterium]
MKIAILVEILNKKSGSRAPIELAIHLAKKHDVYFFAYSYLLDRKTDHELKELGIKIILFPYCRPYFLTRFLAALTLPFLLKKFSIDLVSSHACLPLFLGAMLAQKPIIRTYYGTQQDVWFERLLPEEKPRHYDKLINQLLNRVILLRENFFFNHSHKNIAISKYTREEAKRLYQKDIPYIYLGADSSFAKTHFANKNKKRSDKISFLAISRLTPYKNFHLLIKAFKKVHQKIPQTKLVIAGSAPNLRYLNYLRKLAQGYPVQILVNVSDLRLEKLYKTSDIYLSADRFSFFGLPPLEAALFGLPTIALDFAALPEIVIHGQTGLIAHNQKGLTAHMTKLANNLELAYVFGQKARRQTQQKFRWQDCARQYQQVFLQVTAS